MYQATILSDSSLKFHRLFALVKFKYPDNAGKMLSDLIPLGLRLSEPLNLRFVVLERSEKTAFLNISLERIVRGFSFFIVDILNSFIDFSFTFSTIIILLCRVVNIFKKTVHGQEHIVLLLWILSTQCR